MTLQPSSTTRLGFLLVALTLPLGGANAEQRNALPVPFPGLTTLVIEGQEAAMPEQISYDPAISKLINKPLKELLPGETDAQEEITRVISTLVDRKAETRYTIDFDPGPSADPSFVIIDETSKKRIGSIGADALVVPGNGFLYSVGRSNEMHLEHRKFAIRDGALVEIKQPFSYVGLDSKANVPLTLTAGKSEGEVIANIPKGDPLQVVVRDEEYLLIKTQFGLVGWWKMKTDVMAANAEIEGIYYAGD